MKGILLKTEYLWIFGLPLLLIAFLIALVQSPFFGEHPSTLSTAITLDLIITIPLLYFLLIRKKESIPKYTVLSVIILGIIAASFILPNEYQNTLALIKTYFLPFIELGILAIVLYKTRQTIKAFKSNKNQSSDFYSSLLAAAQSVLSPRLGSLFATEVAVIYYGFIHWKKRVLQENEFSYHQKSGIIMVIWVLLCMVIAETAVIHLLVEKWSSTIAWVLSAISAYTVLQFFALIKSMTRIPIFINYKTGILQLRYGFFSRTDIPFDYIKTVEVTPRFTANSKEIGLIKLSPLDLLDSHNIILHLKKSHSLTGFYGFPKEFKSIAIFVDKKDIFVNKIKAVIQEE